MRQFFWMYNNYVYWIYMYYECMFSDCIRNCYVLSTKYCTNDLSTKYFALLFNLCNLLNVIYDFDCNIYLIKSACCIYRVNSSVITCLLINFYLSSLSVFTYKFKQPYFCTFSRKALKFCCLRGKQCRVIINGRHYWRREEGRQNVILRLFLFWASKPF